MQRSSLVIKGFVGLDYYFADPTSKINLFEFYGNVTTAKHSMLLGPCLHIKKERRNVLTLITQP